MLSTSFYIADEHVLTTSPEAAGYGRGRFGGL
jgi:hypothetical protein